MEEAIRQGSILLEVSANEGMDPFTFGVNGRVTASMLCEIDMEIADNAQLIMDRGPGDYLIEARLFEGERDQEGGWILAPGWEFDVLSFSGDGQTLKLEKGIER